MLEAVQQVIELLDLENQGKDIFIGHSPRKDDHRVFGGQAVAQALVAANRTVDDKLAHSLKSDFLRAGDPSIPIEYRVERLRDGRSFSSRRVNAIQRDKIIYSAAVSYQIEEEGLTHQIEMGDVKQPDEMATRAEVWELLKDRLPESIKKWYKMESAFDERHIRIIDPTAPEKGEPHHLVWQKVNDQLPDDPQLHQALFAYSSDMNLLDTCTLPHGISWVDGSVQVASLDHSIWFHKSFPADEWFATVLDSPSSSGGRGFNRGLIYSQQGELLASTAQEGLIRVRK